MRKKRDLPSKELLEMIYIGDEVVIRKDRGELYFEVGCQITNDVAEAVVILMRNFSWDDPIWGTTIDVKIEDITPEKSLFWLTGGYDEWRILDHYNRPWCDCYLDFQEEFGLSIINIVKKSKTMKDIRDGFVRYLDLSTLYEFAISKDFVK